MANDSSHLTDWLLQDHKTYISTKLATSRTLVTGNSIFACEKIFKNEKIISIPSRFHINFINILQDLQRYNQHPEEFSVCDSYQQPRVVESDVASKIYGQLTYKELTSLTSFQIVTFYLTLESQRLQSFWSPFFEVLPDLKEFNSVPLIWLIDGDKRHFDELPQSCQQHTLKQLTQFNNDYRTVKLLLEGKIDDPSLTIPKQLFLKFWMGCNSRCLYMKMPESLQKSNEDNFTMVPYVDFLNHDIDEKCIVKVTHNEFQVLSGFNYQPGDQILLCYGAHSNEFLLCEYGFMLDRGVNKWNSIDITSEILDLINDEEKLKFLKSISYYGDYHINNDISFRIEVALLVSQEMQFNSQSPPTRLTNFINGVTSGELYQTKTNKIIKKILNDIMQNCDTFIKRPIHDYKDRVIQRLYEDIEDIAMHHLKL